MLQTRHPQNAELAGGNRNFAHDGPSASEILETLFGFVRRQFGLLLTITIVSVALGAVYIFTTAPKYSATGQLIIDSRKVQLFQQQSTLGDTTIDSAAVDSQVELLKSENLALTVIKDLRLAEDPEFIASGGPFSFIYRFLDAGAPASESQLNRRALEKFANSLSIKRVALTYVIELSFTSLNPDRAAEIANAIAEAYIIDTLEAKYQANRRAAVWLQDRLREIRTQATTADRAVVNFKQENNIVDTGGRLLNEQQLAEVNSALIQVRAQVSEAQARMERVNGILEAEKQGVPFSKTATVTDVLHNEVITRLRQQYLDLSAREADWSFKYGKNHLAAVNLRNQMQEIRRSIHDELSRIAATYNSDYEIAKARAESLQSSLDSVVNQSNTTNQAQITLRELESTSQTYRALADNFLQKYMESVQQQSFPITESRLITRASAPLNKSQPKSLLVLLSALLGGILIAIIAGIFRELSDRVFRTSTQVEGLLGTNCLAILPNLKNEAPVSPQTSEEIQSNVATRTIKRQKNILWHVLNSPFSRFSEGIRSVKLAVDLYGVSKPNKVLAVTSSLPNEGKSTVAMELAELMAHAGLKVLLVDADLRNPSLSRSLAPGAEFGLFEVIMERKTLAEVIWKNPDTNLNFLPAVFKARVSQTSDILGSSATVEFFGKLEKDFDYIIVDLSPLMPLVDARATTNFVDAYIFVIEWGRTKIDVVSRALIEARGLSDNLLGAVLNKTEISALAKYGSYQGNYYSNQYHTQYGYTE